MVYTLVGGEIEHRKETKQQMNKLHKQGNEIILINNNVISARKITKIGQWANVTGCLLIGEIREALFEGGDISDGI